MAFRANKLANRLAVFSKGGNPDNDEEVFNSGLYDKVMQHNNKYFSVSSRLKDLNLRKFSRNSKVL